MKIDDESHDIIIDLDVLLDTRLALLYAISEDVAVAEVNSGRYNKRIRDNFGNISASVFNHFYKKRNKVLLKYALPSNIFKLVNELLIGHISDSVTTKITKVYINTYPYDLQEDEKKIIIGVVDGLFKNCTFELISLNNITGLTPKWVSENVQTVIKYDGLEWLENHSKLFTLSSTPLIDKTLIVPAILSGPIPKGTKIDSGFFQATAISVKSLMGVMFTDIIYFNSVLKK